MDFKKTLVILLLSVFGMSMVGCNENKKLPIKIDFKMDYKFSSEIEEKVRNDTTPWKFQTSASEYALKGDYKNALIQWDSVTGVRNKEFTNSQIDSINQKYTKHDAVEYIIKRAKNSRVLIINEAHHNSLHRFFAKSLLSELYKIGYINLGIEGIVKWTFKRYSFESKEVSGSENRPLYSGSSIWKFSSYCSKHRL